MLRTHPVSVQRAILCVGCIPNESLKGFEGHGKRCPITTQDALGILWLQDKVEVHPKHLGAIDGTILQVPVRVQRRTQ